MDYKAIIKISKEQGCCDACCVRYCGLRKPSIFANTQHFIDEHSSATLDSVKPVEVPDTAENVQTNGSAAKRSKTTGICVSCLGILQEDSWPECLTMTKEILDKKKYDTNTFACALSAPIATIIRDRALVLKLSEMFPAFDIESVTPIKEAWKWSLGPRLASHVHKALDSGATTPLLVTLNMEYADDLMESSAFEPTLDQLRHRHRHQRASAPVTRCLVEKGLDGMTLETLYKVCKWSGLPLPQSRVRCVSVEATHAPVYLGGRYIKLSRELSQSPWVLHGERLMESSVQEIIFQPIADLYQLSSEDAEHRLKFLSAGREDVDVRCLSDGRPFAVEISDPRRLLSAAELAHACTKISESGKVVVHALVPISREKLTELKKGEESKYKTYEALCIKLSHTEEDIAEGAGPGSAVCVRARDVARVNAWCGAGGRAVLQRTPLRVLHRRPLLARTRRILALRAQLVPDHPNLFTVQVETEAGTYIKEWVHGELRRTRPALRDVLRAAADVLALDVTGVALPWP